ncbi:unnamed protein product [Heligmosomoides polygyrus]|uniref:BLOC-1-related complex subunit 7 n=1 Tax=Heligmosomoides polygyrus TaxID=6339 RepID=A0A183GEE2_HELPZ|nr:unnamed protein product [Heligmosomoides polygyrus]
MDRGSHINRRSVEMSNKRMEMKSPERERLLLDEPIVGDQLSPMRATLVEMADAVKTLSQQNVSQLRQVLQTLSGHLVNMENMPATVFKDLDQGSTCAGARTVATMAHSVREHILLECGAISAELAKLKKVEKEKKRHCMSCSLVGFLCYSAQRS